MAETTPSGSLAIKHHNIIELVSVEIASIEYLEGTFAISDGQSADLPPVIKKDGSKWSIDINCGRKKTAPVADAFIMLCGGSEYIYNYYASFDSVPSELNFYFAVKIVFDANGESKEFIIYLAQGSNTLGENWWIGGTAIANRGSNPVIIPIVGYDPDQKTALSRQVYSIPYGNYNQIHFQGWLEPASARDIPTPNLDVVSEATYHHNIVTLKGDFIKNIKWIPGVLMISSGQSSGQNPTVKNTDNGWEIDVYCGRKHTTEVAAAFNEINISQDHMWSLGGFDREPEALNFFVGVQMELEVYGIPQYVTLNFAQGDATINNNWWIGSPVLVANPDRPRIIPVTSSSGQVLQIIAISSDFGSWNTFTAETWFERTAPPSSHKDWLGRVDGRLSIGKVSLPGTHDSAAIAGLTTLNPYVCHYGSLTKQMVGGIRLFDIRLKVKMNDQGSFYFVTSHGDVQVYPGSNEFQSFISAMDEFKLYLATYGGEFLVVSLKIDDWNGYGGQSTEVYDALGKVLQIYYDILYISGELPSVQMVRGQIYLLNRITGDDRFGVPLIVPDNTKGEQVFPNTYRKFKYWVQDWYEDLPVPGYSEAKFGKWKDAVFVGNSVDMVYNFASATLYKVMKVYIMGFIAEFLGQSSKNARVQQLGWSLFDYEFTQYQSSPYGSLNVVDLFIASNFGWVGYENSFTVNNSDRIKHDEL
ncbi:MAG TPA: hypothetical protein VKT70_15320 [Stellaceae bacterium]|nr:hypothetical protein [Stellaceae bacterium]